MTSPHNDPPTPPLAPASPPSPPAPPAPPAPRDGVLREHSYDGIQEYNKRLPNWWLLTFYGAIVFTIIYWFYYHHNHISLPDGERVTAELQQLEAIKMANATTYDDSALWKMSQNPVFTDAGRDTFNTNCATCHMTSLRGRDENPTAVGPNLADTKWLHGGAPTEVLHTVTVGVPDKGMQAWTPQIGAKRVAEAVSYVLSHHKEGEPVETDTTFHAAAQ